MRCSLANVSKRLIASRNVPALRTCSQVSVVKLAIDGLRDILELGSCKRLTAERCDRCVDRLDKDTFAVELLV